MQNEPLQTDGSELTDAQSQSTDWMSTVSHIIKLFTQVTESCQATTE